MFSKPKKILSKPEKMLSKPEKGTLCQRNAVYLRILCVGKYLLQLQARLENLQTAYFNECYLLHVQARIDYLQTACFNGYYLLLPQYSLEHLGFHMFVHKIMLN